MGFAVARLFVTFGGSGGMMTMPERSWLTHEVPRPRLGASLLGGGSGK